MGELVLLLGGQKAGKSSAAARLARATGRTVRLVTPAVGDDPELAERIARHREDRAADVAVDETFAVAEVLAANTHDAIVVDALDTWLLDRMGQAGLLDVGDEPTPLGLQGQAAQVSVLADLRDVIEAARQRSGPTWIIGGLVGMGMHGGTPVARRFEDLHGLATQQLGRAADQVLFVVAGRAIDLAAFDVLKGLPS